MDELKDLRFVLFREELQVEFERDVPIGNDVMTVKFKFSKWRGGNRHTLDLSQCCSAKDA